MFWLGPQNIPKLTKPQSSYPQQHQKAQLLYPQPHLLSPHSQTVLHKSDNIFPPTTTLSTVFITNSSLIWSIHTTKHYIKHAVSKSCILIARARMKLLKLWTHMSTSMCIHKQAHGHINTQTNNLPEMSNATLENVSWNCSSRKILFLSHQIKDMPIHIVLHLVAST